MARYGARARDWLASSETELTANFTRESCCELVTLVRRQIAVAILQGGDDETMRTYRLLVRTTRQG